MDQQCAQKHKITRSDHDGAECQSAFRECQLAHLISPQLFTFFSMHFLHFFCFLKNILSILDYETLSQSTSNSLNLYKHG